MSQDHSAHSKRALAADLLAAMRELGHATFAVAGHDRGARVGYRMALDHRPRCPGSPCSTSFRPAGATVDRRLDDEDRGRRTIACPVLALWGGDGALPRFYDDPLELWRVYAPDITGRAIDGASHFLVEDAPVEVAGELLAFFASG